MIGIGEKLPAFSVVGVKPKFHFHEENGQSAFETLTEASFPGKWKVIFFYPKDFTFVCPTEIAEFARLNSEFADRDAVVLGGSTDNEFVKLAWRRNHKDLDKLPIWSFADTNGSLTDGLGVRSPDGLVMFPVQAGESDITIKYIPPLWLELIYWLNLGSWIALFVTGLVWLLIFPGRPADRSAQV